MLLFEKAVGLYARFGEPIRFGAKVVLGTLLPGSPAVVELIEELLERAQEAAEGRSKRMSPLAATAEDLKRAEALLDLLGGDLRVLLGQVAALEGLPDAAQRILTVSLEMDDRVQAAVGRLDALVQSFDRLEEQNRHILARQAGASDKLDEVLALLRGSGVADFVAELQAGGLRPGEFGALLGTFREAAALMGRGDVGLARDAFMGLARERPRSPAVAVALAGAEAASGDLLGAERQLARATRLAPRSAKVLGLHRGMTILGWPPSASLSALDSPLLLAPLPALDVESLLKQRTHLFGGPHLAVESLLHLQSLAADDDWTDTYALLTLIPLVTAAERNRNLNVALVLDVSASMYEEDGTGVSRLSRVQEAVHSAIQKLKPEDHLSIVAFAHDCQVVLPATSLSEKAKIEEVISRIDRFDVDPAGSAALDSGIHLALSEIEKNRDSGLSWLVILSDGGAGEQDEQDEIDLDLEINEGEAGRSARSAADRGLTAEESSRRIEENCRHAARRIAQSSVGLTLVGIGADWNRALFVDLACLGKGNWCYLNGNERASEAARLLTEQFEGRVGFHDVEITIQPLRDVQIKRVWQVAPAVRELALSGLSGPPSALLVRLGADQGARFLLELRAPRRAVGQWVLAQMELRYDFGPGVPECTGPIPLTIRYSATGRGHVNALVQRYLDAALGLA